jgi:precorrin-2 methylase
MRLTTKRRYKLKKALSRVEKVVIMDTRNNIEQQKKWKAKLAENKKNK